MIKLGQAIMDFNWNIEDEIVVALENPDYSDFSIYESYVQSLSGEQPSEFLDPALLSGTEWTSACVNPTPGQEAYPDPPSKSEESVPSTEVQAPSCELLDAVDYKVALLGLELRLNALEECRESVERRVGELEEKVKILRSG